MDVVSRHRPGSAPGTGSAVDPAEYVLSGGEPAPRPWVLPLVVGLGVLLGVVSVPVLMSLGGDDGAETVAGPVPSASAGATAGVAVAAPTTAAAAAPSRAPRPALSLAAPPPPAPPNLFTRSSASASPSASRQGNADPGSRTASLEPTSGPAGKVVTISGRCTPGTDTGVVAGSTTAQRQDLAGDGSFRTDYQVPTSAKESVKLVVRCLDADGATSYQFDLLYRVTATSIQVPGDLSGAGNLDAPDSAAVDDMLGVSAGGFMGGAGVVFQVRDADTGRVLSSGQPVADGNGNVTVDGVRVPQTSGGRVQVVMAGLDPDGAQRVLAHVISTG